MSFENFFWAKTSVARFIHCVSFESCRQHCKESHYTACNWCANHVGIKLQVSNYQKFKLDICNWTPMWLRVDYVANRCTENQSWSRIFIIPSGVNCCSPSLQLLLHDFPFHLPFTKRRLTVMLICLHKTIFDAGESTCPVGKMTCTCRQNDQHSIIYRIFIEKVS